MITLEDYIGLCDSSEEEILAIAEHDQLPEIAAIAKAQYLFSKEQGPGKYSRSLSMIFVMHSLKAGLPLLASGLIGLALLGRRKLNNQ